MYNFRPLDDKLFQTCAENNFCTDCPMRMGCLIRYRFYIEDLSYEITSQLAEISLVERCSVPEDIAYKVANSYRKKRERELRFNPYFSYK